MTPQWIFAFLLATELGLPTQSGRTAENLALQKRVSQYGITWTFNRPVPVGQFINGDFYVVGPVTVTAIDPAPKPGRNGSMLNPPQATRQGYDSRGEANGHYDPRLQAKLPIVMSPGDSLVSSISIPENARRVRNIFHGEVGRSDESHLLTAAVLTCMAREVPADTFRPSYAGHQPKLYHFSDLHLNLLPNITPVQVKGMPTFKEYDRLFQRPWLDHVYGWGSRMLHAAENMPDYGRGLGMAVGNAALLLECNYPLAEKKSLLIGFVQYGIDLWGILQAGGKGWPAQGGYGEGRKWPILFAGILFKDKAMEHPRAEFDEDEHTAFGKCWTGATVVDTGQFPFEYLQGGRQEPDRAAYENLPPSKWPGPQKAESENYRRCCTSVAYVGEALAARLMHAVQIWSYAPFFAYVDRWMYEDDTAAVQAIKAAGVADYAKQPWARQRQCDNPWVEAMWAKYRPPMGNTDVWKTPHPGTTGIGNPWN